MQFLKNCKPSKTEATVKLSSSTKYKHKIDLKNLKIDQTSYLALLMRFCFNGVFRLSKYAEVLFFNLKALTR